MINIKVDSWLNLGAEAGPIRHAVFILEQHVPIELEWDEMDAVSLHAVAYGAYGSAVATGRLLPDGHIGRMAVLKSHRGLGFGRAILEKLVAAGRLSLHLQQLAESGCVVLNAQLQAEAFYARLGFTRFGAIFMEAGIPHIKMRRNLS